MEGETHEATCARHPADRSYCIREGRSRIGQQPAIDERRRHHKLQAAPSNTPFAALSYVALPEIHGAGSRVSSGSRPPTSVSDAVAVQPLVVPRSVWTCSVIPDAHAEPTNPKHANVTRLRDVPKVLRMTVSLHPSRHFRFGFRRSATSYTREPSGRKSK